MRMFKVNWNNSVKNCDHSSAYHLRQWGELLEKVHGHKLIYLNHGDSVFPVAYVQSRIFGNRLISLPFADYGGLCTADNDSAIQLIFRCRQIAQHLNVDFIEIRGPDHKYYDELLAQGFIRRDEYLTFILSLDTTLDALWKGIGDKNRNMVRRAEKSNVRIIEASNKNELRAFYLIYSKTMKKLGSPPQPFSFFESMWDLFYPDNLKIPLAICDGEYIAAGIYLLHNDTVHHAYSCSHMQYQKLAPNNLIQWYMIKWANQHGCSKFGFGRSRPDEGGVLFKRRWGGQVSTMPYFYKFYKKEMGSRQEIKYRGLSRLWARYMPEQLAGLIGPWIIKQIG